MGGNFPHRWGQTREAVQVMKEIWTKDEAEFHGKFYDFPPSVRPQAISKASSPDLPGGIGQERLQARGGMGGWLDADASHSEDIKMPGLPWVSSPLPPDVIPIPSRSRSTVRRATLTC